MVIKASNKFWTRVLYPLGIFLLGLMPELLWSQVNMEAVLSPREDISRQAIELNIIVYVLGEGIEQNGPLRLPDFSKFRILGSSSIRNELITRGEIVHQTIYSFLLEPKTEGKIKIGSAIAEFNGKLFKTEPFDINIEPFIRKRNTFPFVPNDIQLITSWKQIPRQAGEPGLLVVSVTSPPEGVSSLRKTYSPEFFSSTKEAEIIPVEPLDEEPIIHQGSTLSRVIGRYWIIPQRQGLIQLPRVKINLASTSLSNQPPAIHIAQPPAEKLIGKSSLSLINLKKAKHSSQGNPLQIRMILENQGTAPISALPKLLAGTGDKIFPPNIQRKIQARKDHLSTQIIADYIIIPATDSLSLRTSPWSWIDPTTQKIHSGEEVKLKFSPAGSRFKQMLNKTTDILENGNEPPTEDHPPVLAPPANASAYPSPLPKPEEHPLPWLWISLFGILFGLPFVFLIRKKKSPPTQHKKHNPMDMDELEDIIRKKNQMP